MLSLLNTLRLQLDCVKNNFNTILFSLEIQLMWCIIFNGFYLPLGLILAISLGTILSVLVIDN
jgi:hypothetical protein